MEVRLIECGLFSTVAAHCYQWCVRMAIKGTLNPHHAAVFFTLYHLISHAMVVFCEILVRVNKKLGNTDLNDILLTSNFKIYLISVHFTTSVSQESYSLGHKIEGGEFLSSLA